MYVNKTPLAHGAVCGDVEGIFDSGVVFGDWGVVCLCFLECGKGRGGWVIEDWGVFSQADGESLQTSIWEELHACVDRQDKGNQNQGMDSKHGMQHNFLSPPNPCF